MHRLGVGGLKALLAIPAAYLALILAVVATVLQQSAFHAGELESSVPTMLPLEPLVAMLVEVVALGEHLFVSGLAGRASRRGGRHGGDHWRSGPSVRRL